MGDWVPAVVLSELMETAKWKAAELAKLLDKIIDAERQSDPRTAVGLDWGKRAVLLRAAIDTMMKAKVDE